VDNETELKKELATDGKTNLNSKLLNKVDVHEEKGKR
jgi:hypothetical protein